MYESLESIHPMCLVFYSFHSHYTIGSGYRYTRSTTRKQPDWKKAYVFIDSNYKPSAITTQEAKEELKKAWSLYPSFFITPFHLLQQTFTFADSSIFTHLVLTSRSLASLLEIILEAAGHRLQIAHTTRSLTTTTRTLQSPVVYAHHSHSIRTYSVSSSHQDNRKNRNGSSGCGKHDDRIFCKSCGSCHVSYQMKKYLSSTIIVSTTTHKHTPFVSSLLLFHSSLHYFITHSLTIRF